MSTLKHTTGCTLDYRGGEPRFHAHHIDPHGLRLELDPQSCHPTILQGLWVAKRKSGGHLGRSGECEDRHHERNNRLAELRSPERRHIEIIFLEVKQNRDEPK